MERKRRKDSFFGLHFDFHANPDTLTGPVGGRLTADMIREKTGAVVITSSPLAINIANDKGRLFEVLCSDRMTTRYITEFAKARFVSDILAVDSLRLLKARSKVI